MIYLDTSVALAEIPSENRKPDPAIWRGPLVSSRLLQDETWGRIHARRLAASHGESVRDLLARVSLLRTQRVEVVLATFDERIRGAAWALGISLTE